MNDMSPLSEMAVEPSHKGKDAPSRSFLIALVVLWLLLLIGLLVFVWNAYFQQKNTAQTLAQQIAFACKSGDFGPGLTEANEQAMCSNAQRVIENQSASQGIQGPPGPPGRDGRDGSPGKNGIDGVDGRSGKPGKNGTNGINGLNGKDGLAGKDGTQGPPGKDGLDGKDGAPGPSGVVQVTTVGCDGPIIHQISAAYDAASQTVTITCN